MKYDKLLKEFAKQKALYRRSKEWNEFRAKMIKLNPINIFTGLPYSGTCTLHHKNKCTTIEEYKSQVEQDFTVLQSSQHSILHDLARLKCAPNSPLDQIQQIIKPLIGQDWISKE